MSFLRRLHFSAQKTTLLFQAQRAQEELRKKQEEKRREEQRRAREREEAEEAEQRRRREEEQRRQRQVRRRSEAGRKETSQSAEKGVGGSGFVALGGCWNEMIGKKQGREWQALTQRGAQFREMVGRLPPRC